MTQPAKLVVRPVIYVCTYVLLHKHYSFILLRLTRMRRPMQTL